MNMTAMERISPIKMEQKPMQFLLWNSAGLSAANLVTNFPTTCTAVCTFPYALVTSRAAFTILLVSSQLPGCRTCLIPTAPFLFRVCTVLVLIQVLYSSHIKSCNHTSGAILLLVQCLYSTGPALLRWARWCLQQALQHSLMWKTLQFPECNATECMIGDDLNQVDDSSSGLQGRVLAQHLQYPSRQKIALVLRNLIV